MANFGTLVITTAGVALQGKLQAGGTTLTFTRVAIGDGTLLSGTNLAGLTNLINPKMSVTINSITINNGLATLKFTFSNNGLITGFNLRELGIFATDPDTGEILYAVANAGDNPDYLPAEGSNIVEEIFEVVAAIGSTANVTATIDQSLTFLPLVGGNMAGAINGAEVVMAAAAMMGIGTAAGNFILVTGTTTITAFDNVQAGARRTLKFTNPLTITYNATGMILPGATNLAVSAGDVAEFISLGNGNWACINYQPAVGNLPSNGTAVNASKLNNTASGNASGNTPVSNGTVCTNLNADMVDGKHANDSANNIPVYDASKNISGNAATAANVTANINGHSISSIFESDGVTVKSATNGIHGKQLFTSSSTFVVPANVQQVWVSLAGGGGGGGGGTSTVGGGGGAGGDAILFKLITGLSAGQQITVTVGNGGTGGAPGGADGTDGGNSSFGTYAFAAGGAKGNGSSNSSWGGLAITTNGNTSGSNGGPSNGGSGGNSMWGGGGLGYNALISGSYGGDGDPGGFYGGGGAGGYLKSGSGGRGGAGAPGFVLVEW